MVRKNKNGNAVLEDNYMKGTLVKSELYSNDGHSMHEHKTYVWHENNAEITDEYVDGKLYRTDRTYNTT